jgi:hypothetical protein
MSKKFLDNATAQNQEQLKGVRAIVKNYGLNAENVFGPETATATASTPAGTPAAAVSYPNTYEGVLAFTREKWKDRPDILADLVNVKNMDDFKKVFSKTYDAFMILQGGQPTAKPAGQVPTTGNQTVTVDWGG